MLKHIVILASGTGETAVHEAEQAAKTEGFVKEGSNPMFGTLYGTVDAQKIDCIKNLSCVANVSEEDVFNVPAPDSEGPF